MDPFMFWLLMGLMVIPYGDIVVPLLGSIPLFLRGPDEATVPDPSFIESADFMFPENFLSRFPEEAESFRLKIFAYLIFNLLVKGYGLKDPGKVWENYNREDFYRALVDAVFYEYLTNFTDKGDKDHLFNPLEDRSNLLKPESSEEIAVDRIGEYLDLLSENKPPLELIKGAYDILSKTATKSRRKPSECDMPTVVLTSGLPGKDYPNFCDIPKTSFSCSGKKHGYAGIYADYETGCQAFHVCWPGRKDSFLCPIGTIFNQTHKTCAIWHDTGCFSLPLSNWHTFPIKSCSIEPPTYNGSCESLLHESLRPGMKIMPAKCKVNDVSQEKTKTRDVSYRGLKVKLEAAFNKIKDMLKVLAKMMSDLNKRSMEALGERLKSIPRSRNVTDATGFLKKFGDSDFKSPQATEEMGHLGKTPSGMKPVFSVTRSASLMPSRSIDEQLESSRNQDVPKIVMKSLELGGTILNEGIFPLAKKVMMDSYRKIESKEY